MGNPLPWHRRHALYLASQLPEKQADAELVLQAVRELLDKFMSKEVVEEVPLPENVLAFPRA